jgi:hypothetical protein
MALSEKAKTLVGTWEVEASADVNNQDMFPKEFAGLYAFTDDGVLLASITPGGVIMSPGYGNWVSLGLGEAAYTLEVLWGSPEGKLTARQKTVGKVSYDDQTDCWKGPVKTEIFFTDESQPIHTQRMHSGTRLQVEVLA